MEELPLYEPGGKGEHLYLFIEKTGLTTTEAIARIARAMGVKRGEVGYAGLKDRQAVTRQLLSIRLPDPATPDAALRKLADDAQLKVLWLDRHTNKLRLGHLAGNRFVIRIRDVEPTAVVNAKRVLDRLTAAGGGVPNFVGEQRFGMRGNSQTLGRLLLLGDHDAFAAELLGRPGDDDSPATRAAREVFERGDLAEALEHWPRSFNHERLVLEWLRQGRSAKQAVLAIDRRHRAFLVNAWQSEVFNAVLARRLEEGTLGRLIPGDLAWKHDNGAVFAVDEAVAEVENRPDGRATTMQVSPSGPLWGPKMMQASGAVGDMEAEALEASGMSTDTLAASPAAPKGARRPLRIPLANPDLSGGVDAHGPHVRVAFDLPPGAYATTVLREIMKPSGNAPT